MLPRLMDGTTVLVSKAASEAGRAGEVLGAPTHSPGVVTGESKTGVNSSFGLVTVSTRS